MSMLLLPLVIVISVSAIFDALKRKTAALEAKQVDNLRQLILALARDEEVDTNAAANLLQKSQTTPADLELNVQRVKERIRLYPIFLEKDARCKEAAELEKECQDFDRKETARHRAAMQERNR